MAAYIHWELETRSVAWREDGYSRSDSHVRKLNSSFLNKASFTQCITLATHKLKERQFMLANTGIVGPGSPAFLASRGKIDKGRTEQWCCAPVPCKDHLL